jgi:hypothetical protein
MRGRNAPHKPCAMCAQRPRAHGQSYCQPCLRAGVALARYWRSEGGWSSKGHWVHYVTLQRELRVA